MVPAFSRPAASLAAILVLICCSRATAQSTVTFAGFEHEALGFGSLSVDAEFTALAIDGLSAGRGGFVYQVDAEGGSIQFGDGIRGTRPSTGEWNVQGEYRYGGGATPSIDATASVADLTVAFDFQSLTTAPVRGTISEFGALVVDDFFPPFSMLSMQEWPSEVELLIDAGEMVLSARWDLATIVQLPNQQSVPCDEAIFRSQTGGMLAGEELETLSWEGFLLPAVQILGEQFREDGNWYEIEGDLLLTRTTLGHELTHVLQQGPGGSSSQFPPNPCLDPNAPDARQANGIVFEELNLPPVPQIGTRIESYNYMSLPAQPVSRIPTHSVEWTNFAVGDPGMALIGGLVELGALSYTVQVFDDGLLIATESGLGSTVARAPQFVVQHNQTDFDFAQQRASTQIDFGSDVQLTLLGPTALTVTGDRIHIIPEQLQIFPDCIEGVAAGVHKVSDVTLKRGVIGAAVQPATVFGLPHQATGDAVLRLQGGALVASNEYWGPNATGPLAGGVRVPLEGLQGWRWELPGDQIPSQLPFGSSRSFLLHVLDAQNNSDTAGLVVQAQGGQFEIAADFLALGSAGSDFEAWLGTQMVASGTLDQQGRVLVDSDLNEATYVEDADGIVQFDLRWNLPHNMLIGGQPVFANRVSERLRHRNRAITIFDYEQLLRDSPSVEVHRASVRKMNRWWSAVGSAVFEFAPSPSQLRVLLPNPMPPSGVEVEVEQDASGTPYASLRVADPSGYNAFDGDEMLMLLVQEADTGSKRAVPPGYLYLTPQSGSWQIDLDFAASGYTAFQVLADGVGEVLNSSPAVGSVATAGAWPVAMKVSEFLGDLLLRLSFAAPTPVTPPGGAPILTQGLTVVLTGPTSGALGSGTIQLLAEGLELLQFDSTSEPVSVSDPIPSRSEAVLLHPAVPNPFNPRTELRYELGSEMEMTLSLFDVAGRRVRTLLRGVQPPGPGSVVWDGSDARGRPVGSGVYFARLQTASGLSQQKLLLLR